jgi:hypothetical protein
LQADQEEEEDQLGSPLCDQRDLGEISSPCPTRLVSRERRSPMQTPSAKPLSLSLISPSHRHRPPIDAHHPAGTLPRPRMAETVPATRLRPGRRHCHRWTPCLARTPPTTDRTVTSPPDPP